MGDLQVELQAIAGRLNRLTLEGDRLMRTRETLRTTHDRLERLTEEEALLPEDHEFFIFVRNYEIEP